MWRVFYRARMKKVTVTACNVSRVLQGTDEESDVTVCNVSRVLQGTDEESDGDGV